MSRAGAAPGVGETRAESGAGELAVLLGRLSCRCSPSSTVGLAVIRPRRKLLSPVPKSKYVLRLSPISVAIQGPCGAEVDEMLTAWKKDNKVSSMQTFGNSCDVFFNSSSQQYFYFLNSVCGPSCLKKVNVLFVSLDIVLKDVFDKEGGRGNQQLIKAPKQSFVLRISNQKHGLK